MNEIIDEIRENAYVFQYELHEKKSPFLMMEVDHPYVKWYIKAEQYEKYSEMPVSEVTHESNDMTTVLVHAMGELTKEFLETMGVTSSGMDSMFACSKLPLGEEKAEKYEYMVKFKLGKIVQDGELP